MSENNNNNNNLYKTDTHYLFMYPNEKILSYAHVCYPADATLPSVMDVAKQMEKETGSKVHIVKPGEIMLFVKKSDLKEIQDPNHSTLVIAGDKIGWVWASTYRFHILPVVVKEDESK